MKRGDYEVIRPEDGQIISRSDLATAVEPGMVLEISIILRQNKTYQDNAKKCPRCNYINYNATGDWILWKVLCLNSVHVDN